MIVLLVLGLLEQVLFLLVGGVELLTGEGGVDLAVGFLVKKLKRLPCLKFLLDITFLAVSLFEIAILSNLGGEFSSPVLFNVQARFKIN